MHPFIFLIAYPYVMDSSGVTEFRTDLDLDSFITSSAIVINVDSTPIESDEFTFDTNNLSLIPSSTTITFDFPDPFTPTDGEQEIAGSLLVTVDGLSDGIRVTGESGIGVYSSAQTAFYGASEGIGGSFRSISGVSASFGSPLNGNNEIRILPSGAIEFEGTANSFETSIVALDPTSDNVATLQDADGTIAYLSDIPAPINYWSTIQSDSGSTSPGGPANTLTFDGSGIITTSIVGDTVTITGIEQDGSTTNELQDVFRTISTSSGTSPIPDSITDTLSLTAGTGVTVTGDSSADSVTFSLSTSGVTPGTYSSPQITVDTYGRLTTVSETPISYWATIEADTGSTSPSEPGDTLTVLGSGIAETSLSGDTLTITATEAQNLFQTISVSGQSDVIAETVTDTLSFAAGSGVTLTTNDSTDTVTFAVTGSTFQPLNALLTAISGLSPMAADRFIYTTGSDAVAAGTITSAGRNLIDDLDVTTQRTTLGLGTIATQAANSVDIDGGAIDGTTIGANSATAGTFTALTSTSHDLNGTYDQDATSLASGSAAHAVDFARVVLNGSGSGYGDVVTGASGTIGINSSGTTWTTEDMERRTVMSPQLGGRVTAASSVITSLNAGHEIELDWVGDFRSTNASATNNITWNGLRVDLDTSGGTVTTSTGTDNQTLVGIDIAQIVGNTQFDTRTIYGLRIAAASNRTAGYDLYNAGTSNLAGTTTVSNTFWKDFPAIASTSGAVGGWIASSDTHLSSSVDGQIAFFPINYEVGSTITRLRVKYDGNTSSDGVIVSFLRRDESSTTTSWTDVFSATQYLSSSVAVQTIDITDHVILANNGYVIKVESQVSAAQAAQLYSVGIETSIRVQ